MLEGRERAMSGGIHIATIAGIRININYSWLIILVLLTISLAAGWFPAAAPGLGTVAYYILGFIAAICSYFICYYLIVTFRQKDETMKEMMEEMEETGEDMEI